MGFAVDLSKFAQKANGNIDAVVRKIVLDVGTRLVNRSPVGDPVLWKTSAPAGYVGGRFRANWQYGFNVAPSGVRDTVDPSGNVSQDQISQGARSSPVAGMHYIVNNLPYAQALEDGHSSQAPHGMVMLTVLEFASMTDRAGRELAK